MPQSQPAPSKAQRQGLSQAEGGGGQMGLEGHARKAFRGKNLSQCSRKREVASAHCPLGFYSLMLQYPSWEPCRPQQSLAWQHGRWHSSGKNVMDVSPAPQDETQICLILRPRIYGSTGHSPRSDPTTIMLLNGHSIKQIPKVTSYPQMTASFTFHLRSFSLQ